MDQAFYTSNNNLASPIQLKYFTAQIFVWESDGVHRRTRVERGSLSELQLQARSCAIPGVTYMFKCIYCLFSDDTYITLGSPLWKGSLPNHWL